MSNSVKKVCFDDWKEESKLFQENICKQLGDRIWDEFSYPSEKKELFQKICIALYGSPSKAEDNFGLPAEKVEFVNSVIEKLHDCSIYKDKIIIGVIFVSIYIEDEIATWVPVFRVLHRVEKEQMTKEDVRNNLFIDHIGRVYKDYSSYLNDNTWERSWLYLPKDGYYENCECEFDNHNTGPDCEMMLDDGCYDIYEKKIICKNEFLFHDQTSRGVVTKVFDSISNYTNIGSTVGMLSGLILTIFPPTAPIGAAVITCSGVVGAPGAIYGVGRSVEKIVDRYQHDQSISLADSEARQCWLITASSAASIGALSSAGILTRMAKSGVSISGTVRGICTGINVTAISLSGASIANSGYELYRKEEVTTLDIIQFSTSLLFFTHSLVTFKTAKAIIEETQQAEIAAMKNNLSQEHHKKFDSMLKNVKKSAGRKGAVGEDKTIQGQADFIRKLKTIDDPNEYFQSIRITKKGNYCLNNKLSINPKKYVALTKNEEQILLSSTKDLQEHKITMSDFNKKVNPLVKKHRLGVLKSKMNNTKSKTVSNNNSKTSGTLSSNATNLKQDNTTNKKSYLKSNNKQPDVSFKTLNDSFSNNELAKGIINSFFGDYKHEIMNLGNNFIKEIISFILKILENEIRIRTEENSNPQRPDSMQVEQFYASQVSNERRFKNLCESACMLVTTCRDCNIEIPARCLELILENIEGRIFNVTWSVNEPIITCCFLSESSDEISFDFHIGNKHFVTNIFKNGASINRPMVYPLPAEFLKLKSSNNAKFPNCCESLSDLAATCTGINADIPEECFEFILKSSKGKVYGIKWLSNDNCITCTFLTEQSCKMTIEFFLGDKFFLSRVHENEILCEDIKINHLELDDD